MPFILDKRHEFKLKLSRYLDLEGTIGKLCSYLVIRPYCIDDSQHTFIVSENTLMRELQASAHLKE